MLFIYLFSNAKASVCGLYELPIRFIAFETGLSVQSIEQSLEHFAHAGKVSYDAAGNVVWVHNMSKYQSSSSPKLQACIQKDIEAVPDCPLKRAFLGQSAAQHTISGENGCGSSTILSISSQAPSQGGSSSVSGRQAEPEGWQAAVDAYTQNIGVPTPMAVANLRQDVDEYGAEWVIAAVEEAVRSGVRSLKYVDAILKRWKRDGRGSQKPRPDAPAEPKGFRAIREHLAREEQNNGN